MDSSKPKVLVTGCSGRLGEEVLNRFSDNFTVIGLDIVKPEDVPYQDYYYMDIGNDLNVETALRHIKEKFGSDIASVIHLAAYYSFGGEQKWELYQKITIDGTKRLIKHLKQFNVEQFLFSSTQLVYSPCSLGDKINENSPIKPKWDYPKSKVQTENILFEEHEKIPLVIFRIAGCYDNACNSIPLSQQIKRIYENKLEKHVFPGDPRHGSPFLHIEDLVEAIYLTVEKRKELSSELVLLIGESKTYSYDQIQKRLGQLILGKEFNTIQIPKWIAKMGSWIQNHIPFYPKPFVQPWMIDIADDHYELDISLSKERINWEPKHDVYDTLPEIVSDLKNNPKAFYKRHNL